MTETERKELVSIQNDLQAEINKQDSYKNRITIDGNGRFYRDGVWISPIDVLTDIAYHQDLISVTNQRLLGVLSKDAK